MNNMLVQSKAGYNKGFHKIFMAAFIGMIFCLYLCGCSANQDNREVGLQTQPYIAEQQVNTTENITIYAYNEKTSRLESQVVQLTISPDQSTAEVALDYLLSTPNFEFALNEYDIPDYTLINAEGIATVHITNKINDDKSNPYKYFALHFSIVNTLCSIDGINYVSVYAGDKELSGNVYIGPSSFLEKNINEYYAEYYGSGSLGSSPSLIPAILYYGDKSQTYVVPEYHHIYANVKKPEETISTIIEKLANTPSNSTDLISPIVSNLIINSIKIQGDTVVIDFDKSPCHTSISNQSTAYASMYHTITGVYPNIKTISFTVAGSPAKINGVDTELIDGNSFPDIIGTNVTLFMTHEAVDGLYPVHRYLNASSGISIIQMVEALAQGPTKYDDKALKSPFMGGLTTDNLISAKVVNNIAILNFDTSFYDCVRNLSPKEETIMVYSIVNTITTKGQINGVQFLINNQSFETINNHIYYSMPLLYNPGLMYQ